MKIKIVKEVNNFISKCAKEVGKFEAEDFDMTLFHEYHNHKIQSPIEQTMHCAIKTIVKLNRIKQLNVFPQHKVGTYRVDFYIEYGDLPTLRSVIVECDSQKFHDRNEKQRRYEKARSRFIVMAGYKAFHYTGAEIMKNALSLAVEIVSYLTGTDAGDLQTNSNIEE